MSERSTTDLAESHIFNTPTQIADAQDLARDCVRKK